jgi:hypothetical protein
MINSSRIAASVVALSSLCLFGACGTTDESRPIEVIYYVSGQSGTRFAVDGIQAANGNHPGARPSFEAPFFFVLENARQFSTGDPIRGCFRTFDNETAAITVYLYFGTQFQRSVVLQPGQCYGPGYDPQNPPDCDDFASNCSDPTGIDDSPEVRFEICPHDPNGPDTPCANAPADGPANLVFSASVGDFDATNITTCLVPEAAVTACATPAIFYLEDPNRVQGIFNKANDRNNDFQLQADAYVGGNLRTSQKDDDNVVIDVEL